MKITEGYILLITGHTLRLMRTKAGLTQKNLADLVGVTQAHISKIEYGKVDPRLSTVNRILGVLAQGKKRKCKDIMVERVFSAKPDDSVLKACEVMVKNAISQMPVLSEKRVVGTITEEGVIRKLSSNIAEKKVKSIMGPPLPTVPEETNVDEVRSILARHQGVLVTRDKKIVGIVARSDLLTIIS